MKAHAGDPIPRTVDWNLLAVLRFVLAAIVVCCHLSWFSPLPVAWVEQVASLGGKAAVIGFLLVSGFSIAASVDRGGTWAFYRRRWWRIYPLYVVAVLATAILQVVIGADLDLPHKELARDTWPTFVGNLFLLQTFVVKPLAFDGPIWSLAVEVFFYLLAPWLWRLKRWALLALIVFSAGCYLLPKHEDWGAVYLVLCKLNALKYAWCWLLGLLWFRERSLVVKVALVGGLAPLMIVLGRSEPLGFVTYLVTIAVLMYADRIRMPVKLAAVADYLGGLSYPLYLLHLPALICAYVICGWHAPGLLAVFALLVTMVAYQLVEVWLKPRLMGRR